MTKKVRGWRRATWLLLALFSVMAAGGTASAQQQIHGIPIFVQNGGPIAQTDQPVSSGIALPFGNPLLDPNSFLSLVDANDNPVPVQFKVLSRWYGTRDDATKSPKWVLVSFLGSAPANGHSVYFLKVGTPASGQLTAHNLPGVFRINTGAAEFSINKTRMTVFDQVTVGGNPVLNGAGALILHDVTGATIDHTIDETVLEELGSVRCVVRQRGTFNNMGLKFTTRYYIYTGQTGVKVDFRLENPGAYGEVAYTGSAVEHIHFEDLKLALNVQDSTPGITTTDVSRDTQGASYKLTQDFGIPASGTQMLTGFDYREFISNTQVNVGHRYEGAMAINGTGGSFSVAVDRFWENYPKAFEAGGKGLSVALWPSFGNGPEYGGQWGTPSTPVTDPLSVDFYRFEGGRWKTHTLHFDFKASGSFTSQEVQDQVDRLEYPMMALHWKAAPFRMFATGHLTVERRNWTKTSRQRWEQMNDILAVDSAADNQTSLGRIGLRKFRERGGTFGGDQMYGWVNFGDFAWGDGYSNLHYDLPWGVLINYLRTHDYRFFDTARDLIAHRRDYDQSHSTNSSSISRGGQAYEKGYWHGNYASPSPSHTWVQGLCLWYQLTGDESTYEALQEAGAWLQRIQGENWDGWWGARILGWSIENYVNLYNTLGDDVYRVKAQAGVQNWISHEQAAGGGGFVLNPGWSSNPHAQTWMHAIVYSAIGKYYVSTFDASVLPVMQRGADWFMNHVVMSAPTGPLTNRTRARVWERFNPSGYYADPSNHHVWSVMDALAHAAICLHDNNYMQMARDMWESVTRYHQHFNESPTDYLNPNTFSPIAFRMVGFPASETKIIGNIGLWSHALPTVELFWDAEW